MSKHTPGPWDWDSDPVKGDLLGRVRYQVVATGKTITRCYYSSGDSYAEWDARLIAAAPMLLEALRDMVSDHAALSPATLEFARAAIRKAEGS